MSIVLFLLLLIAVFRNFLSAVPAQHPERYPGIRLNILRSACLSGCLESRRHENAPLPRHGMHPSRDRKMHPVRRWQELQEGLAQHPERYPGIRLNILRSACLSGCRSKEMIACRRRNGAPARRQCLRHAARPEDV